ncbi:E3 ubiquitin/ISG15 ligase TRIM25-like [Mixophyes fleayi]|uniref:E3 ubiquitin/ISG15 ligase TRIM25-like n=1 Tax=Mixophyes fleayi TaxID=3061075 RepID=UPI003F4E04B2
MAAIDLRAELRCSICMNIYTDPVTLTCGHNFCRVCITRTWDHQTESEYTCPECMQRFKKRPELKRNLTLCNIAEAFLHTHLERDNTGIFCTYCDFPVPAARSCVQCEISMCDNHLRKHDRSVEHTLVPPSTSLSERKCSIHKKILEYFCRDDAGCICATCCLTGDHIGHSLESLIEASDKKKEKLRLVLEKLSSKKVEIDKRVHGLQEHKRQLHEKAAGVTERVIDFFVNIRRQLEVLETGILGEIYRQEEQVLRPVVDLIQRLEIKNDELSRKMRHIEELCNMTDPLNVLQERESGTEDFCNTEMGGKEDRGRPDAQVHDISDLHVGPISETLRTLSDIITGLKKGIYMQEPTDILLDVNTAANNIRIAKDLKTVSWSLERKNYPNPSHRFQFNQILSIHSFSSGRHYWEVETSESGDWRVGVCYPSIDRKEHASIIGNNNKSWCLHRCNNLISLAQGSNSNQYSVIHDGKYVHLPHNISSNSFRIYLDYENGQLCFHELCDPIRHLHTFTTTFTEPLHAVFYVWDKMCGNGSWVRVRSLDKSP